MPDSPHRGQPTAAIREVVLDEMVRIGRQQGKSMPPLTDAVPLLETGLDSLCFAILIATLEDRLSVDPFDGDGPITFPMTVGALIAAYEAASGRK